MAPRLAAHPAHAPMAALFTRVPGARRQSNRAEAADGDGRDKDMRRLRSLSRWGHCVRMAGHLILALERDGIMGPPVARARGAAAGLLGAGAASTAAQQERRRRPSASARCGRRLHATAARFVAGRSKRWGGSFCDASASAAEPGGRLRLHGRPNSVTAFSKAGQLHVRPATCAIPSSEHGVG